MSQMSSCVGIDLAAAAASEASNPPNNSTASTAPHRGNLLMHFMAHTVAQSPMFVHHLPHLGEAARLRAVKRRVKPPALVVDGISYLSVLNRANGALFGKKVPICKPNP
jgi:hypothetical protein